MTDFDALIREARECLASHDGITHVCQETLDLITRLAAAFEERSKRCREWELHHDDQVRIKRDLHDKYVAERNRALAAEQALEWANEDRKVIAAMTFEWKTEVATVVAERDRLLATIEIVVEKCKRFNPHSDSVDRAFVTSMATLLAEASTTRAPISDWATRALAVEQDRDRLRRIADDWQIKAMNAEQERDRLRAFLSELREDMKASSDSGFTNGAEALDWAFQIDAALANATGPVGGGA